MPRVISVAGAGEIFYPVLGRWYDDWDDKRGARRRPCRKDIDPVELRDLLGFINLVDVREDPRDYRIRLMGTKTKPIVGSDITGKRYSEIDPKRKFYFIGEAYTLCIGQATPVLVEADLGFLGRQHLEFARLYLPLSDDGSRINMVMNVIQHLGIDWGRLRNGRSEEHKAEHQS